MQTMIPAALVMMCALAVQSGNGVVVRTPEPAKPRVSGQPAQRELATHATKGVVKSVSATVIVITRRVGDKRTETSYAVTPATERLGDLAAGVTVEVRYRTSGRQRIATAISVEAAPR
jgi:hypothetical protein